MRGQRIQRLVLVVLAGLTVGLLSCGGMQRAMKQAEEKAKNRNRLVDFGLAYHSYHTERAKGPEKIEDIERFFTDPQTKQYIQNNVTVIWKVNIANIPEGTFNVILAYETNSDGNGMRLVMMADGSVRDMNQTEFNTTKKATPK